MADVSLSPDKVSLQLTTHGVIVSVPSALIKATAVAVGLWFAQKTGMDWSSLQTYLGLAVSGGALGSLGLSLHQSNVATQAAADSGALKV